MSLILHSIIPKLNINIMTIKIFIPVCMFAAISLLPACRNNTPKEDNKDKAEEYNEAKFDKAAEKDAQFVVDAADISLTGMNLGQQAQANAVDGDTRELGAMMYNDHKKAYDQLASLAAKKSITIPAAMSEPDKKHYNNLMEKKGIDYDKKY